MNRPFIEVGDRPLRKIKRSFRFMRHCKPSTRVGIRIRPTVRNIKAPGSHLLKLVANSPPAAGPLAPQGGLEDRVLAGDNGHSVDPDSAAHRPEMQKPVKLGGGGGSRDDSPEGGAPVFKLMTGDSRSRSSHRAAIGKWTFR
jgi:hypothetical protein